MPEIVCFTFIPVWQFRFATVSDIKQVPQDFYRITLNTFSQQRGCGHIQKLAKQIKQRSFNRCHGVNSNPLVEGLLATSANIGSVMTLTGNPQNMIIGNFSGIPYARFLLGLAPAALLCLTLDYFILLWGFRRVLAGARIETAGLASAQVNRPLLVKTLACLAAVTVAFFFDAPIRQRFGLNVAWIALAGASVAMVLARVDTHEVLKLVDWHLLLFFAALFVVVEGLRETNLPEDIYQSLRGVFGGTAAAQAWNLTWFSVAGSNIFSNVPFVLVAGQWMRNFAEPELMWKVLALSTTFAGNLTILGSVANVIVVESARPHIEVGFWDYARLGIPITVVTTVVGVAVLIAMR